MEPPRPDPPSPPPAGPRAPGGPAFAGETGGAEPPASSHLEAGGRRSRMVDVGEKRESARVAEARAFVRFPNGILARVLEGGGPKGPIEEVARTAGILAAKRTAELIPLCHPLGLDHVEIRFVPAAGERLEIRCRAACTARTGVEMEAMVGASVAALTVYDMTKSLDHGIAIERIELVEKRGGKSGTWRAAGE
ncbi:MAG: cyclic pyranopterin monophosphate synthase MoaC [Planctomycetota bacterium]